MATRALLSHRQTLINLLTTCYLSCLHIKPLAGLGRLHEHPGIQDKETYMTPGLRQGRGRSSSEASLPPAADGKALRGPAIPDVPDGRKASLEGLRAPVVCRLVELDSRSFSLLR
jgi:hypothetical protein